MLTWASYVLGPFRYVLRNIYFGFASNDIILSQGAASGLVLSQLKCLQYSISFTIIVAHKVLCLKLWRVQRNICVYTAWFISTPTFGNTKETDS